MPQLASVVFRFVSHPVEASPSQLPKPELHPMEQAPSEQLGVPLVPLQTVPQVPQLETVVSVFVSHPVEPIPSQLPNPVAHVPSVQFPVTHDSVAFARLQVWPQPPQFGRLVFRFVSQPLPGRPSQSPRPGLHTVTPHDPLTQLGVPPAGGHTLPQVLQLLTSELEFASQPFAGFPSQSLKPGLQTGTQAVPLQLVVPWPFVHETTHVPQFAIVLSGVSQPLRASPSQLPKPELHVGLHAPPIHAVGPFWLLQGRPQPPQCAVADWVLVSHPSFGLPLQLPKPALQVGVQVPLGQAVDPFVFWQVVVQMPQVWIVFSDASQPSVTSPSQLPKLVLQVIEQAPRAQAGVPFAFEHDVPQAPQFPTLVCVLTSQPLAARPSQLPNPAVQVPSVQVPDGQDSEALAKSHCAPQEPQFVRVVRFVSHPLALLPSQLPKPAVHVPSWQAPAKQVAPALV